MMKLRAALIAGSLGSVLVLSACPDAEQEPTTTGATPDGMTETPTPSPSPSPTPVRPRLRLVGHSNLGGGGFNGDVWAHNGFAYVGVWGGVNREADCPATGVKVASLRDPTRPRVVARLKNPSGTTAEDVVVVSAQTRSFRGDLAAVGIQGCSRGPGASGAGAFRGLLFFDVTKPRRPRLLGRWRTTAPIGCHEIDLTVRRGRVLAGCANPTAARVGQDEAVVIDATNPRRPKTLGGYRAPVPTERGIGCFKASLAHSVRFSPDARRLYVSYWDVGTVVLDITRPRRPRVVRTIRLPGSPDGDTHSVAFAEPDLLLVTSEDFSPAPAQAGLVGCPGEFGAWGQLHVFDESKPRVRRLSTFGTSHSKSSRRAGPRLYMVHNAEVVGGDEAFVSWYSDGVRWVDLSRPRRPREKARFVPPARRDPHGFFGRAPLVWGVKPVEGTDLILASDINSGLWVLRAEGLEQS